MATAETDLIGSQCCVLGIVIKGIATQRAFYTGQMLEAFCHVRNFKICVTVYIQIHITGQIVLVNICSRDDLFSQFNFLGIDISYNLSSFDRKPKKKGERKIHSPSFLLFESFLLVVSLGFRCLKVRISGPPQRPRVCSHRRAWL